MQVSSPKPHPIRLKAGQFVRNRIPKDPIGAVDDFMGTKATALPGGFKGGLKSVASGFGNSVLSGVPAEAFFNSQDYRKGKLKANQYLGEVASNSVGWGVWGLGSTIAGAGLLALGVPGLAAGAAAFAVGTVAATLWGRTGGKSLGNWLGKLIPEAKVKPAVDWVTKHLFNPVYDHIINPVKTFAMQHKIIAGVVGGLALAGTAAFFALRNPSLGLKLGKNALEVGGKLAAGTLAANEITHFTLDKFLPEKKKDDK